MAKEKGTNNGRQNCTQKIKDVALSIDGIFPSGSSSMKSTFPWMQRHYVNYYKGEQLYETNRRETTVAHPRIG
jgi:hypothetical protein